METVNEVVVHTDHNGLPYGTMVYVDREDDKKYFGECCFMGGSYKVTVDKDKCTPLYTKPSVVDRGSNEIRV